MNAGQGFELHPGAAADIQEIWEFIAIDSLRSAGRVREEILQKFRLLVCAPLIGHRRSDLTSHPLRFITVREYLIAYAPDEIPLWIIAVLHGRRNPGLMMAILEARH